MKNSIKRKKFQRDKLLRMINSRLMSVKNNWWNDRNYESEEENNT